MDKNLEGDAVVKENKKKLKRNENLKKEKIVKKVHFSLWHELCEKGDEVLHL